jgi:hypothetical protein
METSKGFAPWGAFSVAETVFVLATAHLLWPLRNCPPPNEIYQVVLWGRIRAPKILSTLKSIRGYLRQWTNILLSFFVTSPFLVVLPWKSPKAFLFLIYRGKK